VRKGGKRRKGKNTEGKGGKQNVTRGNACAGGFFLSDKLSAFEKLGQVLVINKKYQLLKIVSLQARDFHLQTHTTSLFVLI